MLAAIDANSDGMLSDAEQGAYAEQVRRDLSLAVDRAPGPLRLVSFSFPTIHQLTAGVGDNGLRFEGALPTDGSNHSLTFENHHLSAIAVYLVNTLLPSDPGIRILKQDRSYDQSAYRLDVALGAPSSSAQSDAAGRGPQRQWERSDEMSIVGTYFWHGIRHILTGYDHLLFIAALVLGAATLWDLVKVVTAFTVAHSITLTLAAMNLVHLPDWVVEPLISASIFFVALQNIVWPEQSRGGTRLTVAFFFGLFHGFGFAGGPEFMSESARRGSQLPVIIICALPWPARGEWPSEPSAASARRLTFSSFSLQTFDLLRGGAVAASVILCIFAVTVGHLLASHLNGGATQIAQILKRKPDVFLR